MKAPRFRAWRYDPLGGISIAPGHLEMVEGDASIRQAILLLLSTTPGERVMRPDYGCELQKVLFAPNDASTAGLAMHYVRKAVRRWEPRVDVVRVDAGANADRPEQLDIVLEYRVRATQRLESLHYTVNLAGE